ncbi:crossover junction endonuclease MUS81-like [Rhopilema esculentum]|uniref:crossover junction endonuclease MUS81-like n=1 Tax=Rhopilema esculentum TaxID=499914 RepID=UPI0031D6FF18
MPKKSRSQTQCVNPLFLSWLEGWRDDAKEKGLNAQWTYEKAISSLKKYPLPLKDGKEAKILENIGDGIAKKLDKALDEFIRNGGDINAMHALPTQSASESKSGSKGAAASVRKSGSKGAAPPARKKVSQDNDKSVEDQLNLPEPESKKRRKEYMPKQRTGPFALVLTLYRESQDATYKGYLMKEELQRKAELLTEKSFFVAEPGTHYTPWSSMSTLIAKGLVMKTNNPAKYSITDDGKILGEKLDAFEKANPSLRAAVISPSSLNASPHSTSPSVSNFVIPAETTGSRIQSKAKSLSQSHFDTPGTSSSNGNLLYWYVDESGKISSRKDDALVKVEENGIWFLIKCEECALQRCDAVYQLDSARPKEEPYVFAFLSDEHAKNISTPPDIQQWAAKQPIKSTNIVKYQDPSLPQIRESSSAKDEDQASPLFVMKPGTFEIILCVDQMEVTGGANTNSKRMMLEQLKRINVKMDVRKLQLGDFLWVARDKFQGSKKEVVLDFVIERKRMDDLAGSIVDGRFKEQKFRLKSCGLKHPIYLIESYGSMQHMVLPEATLKQAIINSQVVDGLFIRKTDSIYESAAYLSRMTQHLQNIYQNKTIMAFSSGYIKSAKQDQRFRDVIREEVQKFMTFDDYYQITNKNKLLSVKEMFAKQLMQLKGVSADKAASIVSVYETPKRLMTTFEKCKTDEEKDSLLSDLTYGKTKRKIGPMLASQIRMLYTRTKLM